MNFLQSSLLQSSCIVLLAGCSPTTPTAPSTDTAIPTPETGFPARGYHAAAYDVGSDQIIVFGGESDTSHWLSDTWAYDIATNTWTEVSPSLFPGLTEGPLAYDSESDRIILFAGNQILDPSLKDFPSIPLGIDRASSTWAYDYDANAWTDLQAVEGPSGLLGARMVYDTQSDRMILFGGLDLPLDFGNFVFHNETWAYDFNTNKWTNTQSETSPPGRNYFTMAYDNAADRVLVWGSSENPNDNDLWAYDFETNIWTAHPVEKPTNLGYAAMTYVPTLQRAFLFGGVTFSGELPRKEMWTFDFASKAWEQVASTFTPSARGWHTLTYNTNADLLVLIGGGPDREHNTDEVWLFDPHTETWELAAP